MEEVEVSVWSSGLTHVATTAIGIATSNPALMATGSIGMAQWLFGRWQAACRDPLPAEQPTAAIGEQINVVSRFGQRSEWLEKAARQPPTRQSDEEIVERRAVEIARSPNRGSNFDNRIRAVIELKITQRAAQIARSGTAGSDLENWLRAERELKIGQCAEEIARSPRQGTDFQNWVRAEHEVDVSQRAEKIAHSPRAGVDNNANWYRAEHELDAEHAAIRQRAEQIARSPQTAIKIRTHAEIMLRAEGIAQSRPGGTDLSNWIAAEKQYTAYCALLDERARRIAASPEAARWHWDKAEQERRAEIVIRAEGLARANPRASDSENRTHAQGQYEAYRARVDERVRRITASPEAALGHWLEAQRELVTEGRIPPR